MIAFLVGLLMCLSPLTAGISDTGVSYTSSNWAGYVQEGSYTMVSARWTVPVLDCAATPQGLTTDWVGVNGWGGNSGLFQDGTMSRCINGTQMNYAWWTDDDLNDAVQGVFLVGNGDVVSAEVWQRPSGYWAWSVRDVTSGKVASAGEPFYGSGATAEWIAEDPGNLATHKLSQLADFGTVRFSHARYAGTTSNAAPIEMVIHQTGLPQAIPGDLVNSAFEVTYV